VAGPLRNTHDGSRVDHDRGAHRHESPLTASTWPHYWGQDGRSFGAGTDCS
jgi:hypothetical protein